MAANMTFREDYRLTLEGELGVGAPNSIRTKIGAFVYALRRWLIHTGSKNNGAIK